MAKKSKKTQVTEATQVEQTTVVDTMPNDTEAEELTLAQTIEIQRQPGAHQFLSAEEVRIYAKLQGSLCDTMGVEADLSVALLRQNAKAFGLVTSRKGVGGGFFPTDNGLRFIGVDVVSYRSAEAFAKSKRLEAAKAVQKAKAAQRQEMVSAALSSASFMMKAG